MKRKHPNGEESEPETKEVVVAGTGKPIPEHTIFTMVRDLLQHVVNNFLVFNDAYGMRLTCKHMHSFLQRPRPIAVRLDTRERLNQIDTSRLQQLYFVPTELPKLARVSRSQTPTSASEPPKIEVDPITQVMTVHLGNERCIPSLLHMYLSHISNAVELAPAGAVVHMVRDEKEPNFETGFHIQTYHVEYPRSMRLVPRDVLYHCNGVGSWVRWVSHTKSLPPAGVVKRVQCGSRDAVRDASNHVVDKSTVTTLRLDMVDGRTHLTDYTQDYTQLETLELTAMGYIHVDYAGSPSEAYATQLVVVPRSVTKLVFLPREDQGEVLFRSTILVEHLHVLIAPNTHVEHATLTTMKQLRQLHISVNMQAAEFRELFGRLAQLPHLHTLRLGIHVMSRTESFYPVGLDALKHMRNLTLVYHDLSNQIVEPTPLLWRTLVVALPRLASMRINLPRTFHDLQASLSPTWHPTLRLIEPLYASRAPTSFAAPWDILHDDPNKTSQLVSPDSTVSKNDVYGNASHVYGHPV